MKTSSRKNLEGHLNYETWNPNEKLKYLRYLPKDISSVLDVGCGTGELLLNLKNRNLHLEGFDYDKICVEKAKSIVSEVKAGDAQKLASYYSSESFDLITCLHVLEHLPNPSGALLQFREVTKKYVLLAVPNARYIGFEERDTHLFSWNRVTFKNFLKNSGFEVVSISEDWTNIVPKILPLSPLLSRIILRVLYDPFEIVALAKKQ